MENYRRHGQDREYLIEYRIWIARRGGAEVAGWTLDRKIRVRFPAYPHRVWALWWQGGKRRLRTSRCPCRGRLGALKTPSCPWRGCPAAGQNLETGHLSRHYIAEISLNVTLNHNQQQQLEYESGEVWSWLIQNPHNDHTCKSSPVNSKGNRSDQYYDITPIPTKIMKHGIDQS